MCLFIDKKRTKEIKARSKTSKRPLIRYKMIEQKSTDDDATLHSRFQGFYWKVGTNRCFGREGTKLTNTEKNQGKVSYGIHVYNSLKEARRLLPRTWNTQYRLVAVLCNPKDLIAASDKRSAEEVYLQVKLTAPMFKKAIKKTKASRSNKTVDCTYRRPKLK